MLLAYPNTVTQFELLYLSSLISPFPLRRHDCIIIGSIRQFHPFLPFPTERN
ncbi:hypothetical protein K449DRAFT_119537 [Hypoxylon sp. EC38]|nr:hypothetical protein K449DRAFT_119537 [Hypoxylon sp. EC38]